MTSGQEIAVPPALVASLARYGGAGGPAWAAALPALAATQLRRWHLRVDGPVAHGVMALVIPVRLADRTRAVLKLQAVDEETAGEPIALRTWAGRGAVRLLDHDPATGAMLLERLDARRSLASIPDDLRALRILSELLARLASVPAPAGLRRLSGIADRMLERVPAVLSRLPGGDDRALVRTCAAAVAGQLPVTGGQLLHWDLHYDNVLAGVREPWLAIDPKPLAGDPGFELLPALANRWDDVLATGDPARAVRRRFDLMVEILGIDPRAAAAWTLGRVLEDVSWDVLAGATTIDPVHAAVASALAGRRT